MQNASNQMCKDPWLKNGCATNFETRPRFRVIFSFFNTDLFNVFFFFAGRNAARCSKKRFYESLKKARRRHTFECLDRRQKELIPSIWKQFKNKRYHLKFCGFFCYSFIIYFYVYILIFDLLIDFNVFV
jgi:hypothetical protein